MAGSGSSSLPAAAPPLPHHIAHAKWGALALFLLVLLGAYSAPRLSVRGKGLLPSDRSAFACKHEPMTIGGAGVPSPKAYVISVNPARYNRTSALLRRVGLHPVHVQPPSPDSCAVVLDGRFLDHPEFNHMRKTHSNKLAQIAIWRHIANDPDLAVWSGGSGAAQHRGAGDAPPSPPPYSLVFEDDVVLADGLDEGDVVGIAETAAALSADAGLFYLGMCGPSCNPASTETRASGVEFGRCVGRCAHAYGVHKHRAAFLYEELLNAAPDFYYGGAEFFYGDVFLHRGSEHMPSSAWPVLAGVRNTIKGAPEGHVGIFIQDRVSLPSEILGGGGGGGG